ncbi:MAG TPA: PH domain-containing protein [Anaerolineae bacterium]|nr:PH domain-containing protein [Anaerolineae bacterium]
MSISEYQARIKSAIWRELAQNNIDLSALPKETSDELINTITNAALVEMDAILGDTHQQSKDSSSLTAVTEDDVDPDPLKEDVLWTGRPLLSIMTEYIITDERLRIIEGLLGKTRIDIELVRIQNVNQSQSVSERVLNIGDLTIRSHDRTHPVIVLNNIKNPQHVHEVLRRAMLQARKKHGLSYREEM